MKQRTKLLAFTITITCVQYAIVLGAITAIALYLKWLLV